MKTNLIINRLIFFLVRMKLGVKKYEWFRFPTQKDDSTNFYYFGTCAVYKIVCTYGYSTKLSNVSLNYLLSPACKVVKVKWE